MSIKNLCAALVLIPTCIAMLLFYLACGLFHTAQGALAMLSVAAWLVLLFSRRTDEAKNSKRSVCP